VVGGRLSTLLRVSLGRQIVEIVTSCFDRRYPPNLLPYPEIHLKTVPETNDILILPHTYRAPTNFGITEPIFPLWWIGISATSALIELIAYDSHHEIFP